MEVDLSLIFLGLCSSCCKLCYVLILINFLVQAQKISMRKKMKNSLSLMVLLHLICISLFFSHGFASFDLY